MRKSICTLIENKKMPKDQYEFIVRLSKTRSFKIFQNRTKKCSTPDDRRFNYLCESYSRGKNEIEESKDEELREIIEIDGFLNQQNFNQMQENYNYGWKFLPIKPIITSHKVNEAAYYRYTFIPPLLTELALNPLVLVSLKWPVENLGTPKTGHVRDVFMPEQAYTRDNINDVIWLICWIGTYWYHENDEK